MPLLKGIVLKTPTRKQDQYPFNVSTVKNLKNLEFKSPICFFVGENGSGKSTLLEGLAAKLNFPTIGTHPVASDPSLDAARRLATTLQLQWANKVVHQGFFLRAEDFFGFIQRIGQMQRELEREEESLRREMEEAGSSDYGIQLATGSLRGNRDAISSRYGENPDAQSHGESYLQLFSSRIQRNSIYLMDEPEAALSPMRQLAFLDLLLQGEEQGNQFIIATHSPILLAYPGAQIFSFDQGAVSETDYDSLEHVRFTRTFLNNPQAFLHHLKPR